MPFDISSYVAPKNLEHLWQLLGPERPEPVFLSGGVELLLQARDGHIPADRAWIDLTRIPELCGVKKREDGLWIGSSTTYTQLVTEPLVHQYATALALSAREIGAWQIRNRSTLGGNAARGGREADLIPSLYALGARILCHDGERERQLSCDEFYTGPTETALERREIITGVLLPTHEESYSVFLKLKARTMRSTAKVSAAIALRIHNDQYTQARIALGGAAPHVVRATTAEGLLEGQPIGHSPLHSRVADEVRRAALPSSDHRSSARYRKWSIGILAVRALQHIAKQHEIRQTDASRGSILAEIPEADEPQEASSGGE